MATIIPVDGPAGPNSGSGATAPRPPSGVGIDSYWNIVVALRAGLVAPGVSLIILSGDTIHGEGGYENRERE
eukprot:862985-Pyramimonas_sp.AAC.1